MLKTPTWHRLKVESQQPPWHGAEGPQTDVHAPPLHAWKKGQSLAVLQPQLPLGRQTGPFGLVMQLTHAEPLPQALAMSPATHALPAQHEPAPHGVMSVHVLVQTPPVHVGVEPPHLMHLPPVLPHFMSSALPGWHIMPSQHPPLHASMPMQLGEHWCVVGSHASPLGQSVACAQPGGPSGEASEWPSGRTASPSV